MTSEDIGNLPVTKAVAQALPDREDSAVWFRFSLDSLARVPSTRQARLGKLHPLLVDVLIAVAFTAVTLLLGHEARGGAWRHVDTLGYTLIFLANMPVAARRLAPMTVLLSCCAFWIGYISAGYWPAMNGLGAMLALYTVAAHRPPLAALAGSVLFGAVWIYGELASQLGSMWSVVAQALVFPTVVWKFGDNARRLAERNARLAALTEQLRLEQADRARRAVIEERMRIARELHDVVAHHMSVVSVQAGLAGYVFTSDPATARSALVSVRELWSPVAGAGESA